MGLHIEDELVAAEHRRGDFGFGHRGGGHGEGATRLGWQRRVDGSLGRMFLFATGVEGQQCERSTRQRGDEPATIDVESTGDLGALRLDPALGFGDDGIAFGRYELGVRARPPVDAHRAVALLFRSDESRSGVRSAQPLPALGLVP